MNMNNVNLEFSNARGTWNVIVDGEWYYESADYERAEAVFDSFFWNDDAEDESWYDAEDERW